MGMDDDSKTHKVALNRGWQYSIVRAIGLRERMERPT
jgi:hypothetical protein